MDAPAPAWPRPGSNKSVCFKGTWTAEEDSILRDMVMQLGEGNWSLKAQSLPGRIGKQCRERWINHLHPDIKKNNIWTKEEDMVLIEAHKSYGSHWSKIARFLPGRPENSIKNHWNSTKRGLEKKLGSKKKKRSQQVPPRQLSILEEYIHNVEQGSKSAVPQPPSSPPVVDPRVVDTSALEMEMQLNAPNQPGAIDLSNVGANGYWNEAGPSNIGGSGDPAGDTYDFLDLASREFIMPSSEEVSLGLARFK